MNLRPSRHDKTLSNDLNHRNSNQFAPINEKCFAWSSKSRINLPANFQSNSDLRLCCQRPADKLICWIDWNWVSTQPIHHSRAYWMTFLGRKTQQFQLIMCNKFIDFNVCLKTNKATNAIMIQLSVFGVDVHYPTSSQPDFVADNKVNS